MINLYGRKNGMPHWKLILFSFLSFSFDSVKTFANSLFSSNFEFTTDTKHGCVISLFEALIMMFEFRWNWHTCYHWFIQFFSVNFNIVLRMYMYAAHKIIEYNYRFENKMYIFGAWFSFTYVIVKLFGF